MEGLPTEVRTNSRRTNMFVFLVAVCFCIFATNNYLIKVQAHDDQINVVIAILQCDFVH